MLDPAISAAAAMVLVSLIGFTIFKIIRLDSEQSRHNSKINGWWA